MSNKSAVLHFIEEERGKGTSDQIIRHQLLDAGWHMDIIQHAMRTDYQTSSEINTGLTRYADGAGRFGTARLCAVAFVLLLIFATFV
jgi:hypothetical protein